MTAQFTPQNMLDLPDATPIAPLDILGVIRTLWGGKWVIALSALMAVVLAGYYAFGIASPRYAAKTTLHIDTNRFAFADATGPGASGSANLSTEVAIITSRHLLDQVIDQLALQEDPAFNRYLTPVSPWSVTGLRTTIRNQLAGTTDTPPHAQAIRAKTVDNLRRVISARTQRDSAVLEITVTTGSAQTSARIANTLADLYLSDQVDAQFATAETAITWLSDKVFELQVDLARKESAITELITHAQVTDETTLDAISRQAMETDARLNEARAALTKLNDGAALVSANPGIRDTDSARLTNQIAALEVFRSNLSTQLADQSAGLVELQHLRREADATRLLYETFLTRLQDVSLQSGLSAPRSRILNAAEAGVYVAPRKMLILAMAAFLGVAFGTSVVFLRDILRRGFRDAAHLSRTTGLPVVAQLPRKGLHKTPAQDAARNLRTAVLQHSGTTPAQIILCTASIGDEGQKDTNRLLAHALASLGKSVLMFDGDLRSAGKAPDLEALITGTEQLDSAIAPDPHGATDILSTSAHHKHPADIFCSQPFTVFLNRLRERYDHIVITAPPVLPTPDALALAQHSDAVIYAVRSGGTDLQAVLAGQRAMESAGAPITGLVMTGVDLSKKGAAVWPVLPVTAGRA